MDHIVNFGKYKGQSINDIYDKDEQYTKWLFHQELLISGCPAIKEFLISKFKDSDLSYMMTWGKYKSRSIKWIKTHDYSYFEYLLKNKFVNENCPKLKNELLELVASSVPKEE